MNETNTKPPIRVFVSYAREDKRWFQEEDHRYALIPYLANSLRREGVVFWYDQGLIPGDQFQDRIKEEIDRAQVAILIVSQPFLNSDFITKVELPQIRTRPYFLQSLPRWKSETSIK